MSGDRREFLKGAAAAAGLAALTPRARAGDRPNILWLVSEDNSPWFGCYGDAFATTPTLDRMAKQGVTFTSAFANAPVCAPARSTIHTGVYASSAGTEHMRSSNPIPPGFHFFPALLREAGYYCVNGSKTDYNTTGTPPDAWDDRRFTASLRGLKKKQPFFRFINFMTTHESSLHRGEGPRHDPAGVTLAPYHPDTPEIRRDYARYYDRIEDLDRQVGEVLAELEKRGLAEDTIVLYFADHGGVLPRSKRFLYDSGMRVPMIARFPEKYRHLAPGTPGSRVDRLVSFVDLAPTMLALAGVPAPAHMQGRSFMGASPDPEPDYVYGFRARMDERYDLCRAVRDKRFKYIRNYYPHYPWGRHLDYLWKMAAMQSWEREFEEGRLNSIQSRFFGPKPAEELYDLEADPYEIDNLAGDPRHRATLKRMRQENRRHLIEVRDLGFLPEAEMNARSRGTTPYEMARTKGKYDMERIMEAAEIAGERDPGRVPKLMEFLADPDGGVRYWGAVGCAALADEADAASDRLFAALDDECPSVVTAAAVALCRMGRIDAGRAALVSNLEHPDIYVALEAADAAEYTGLDSDPEVKKKADKAASRAARKNTLNALR